MFGKVSGSPKQFFECFPEAVTPLLPAKPSLRPLHVRPPAERVGPAGNGLRAALSGYVKIFT